MVMIANAERGWLEFRDVLEVDGRRVRDHDDRLTELFLKPSSNARQQVARIVEEGARFNLMPAGQFEPPIWLPASMNEDYDLNGRTIAISGSATYANFRRFKVDVSSDLRSQTDSHD